MLQRILTKWGLLFFVVTRCTSKTEGNSQQHLITRNYIGNDGETGKIREGFLKQENMSWALT